MKSFTPFKTLAVFLLLVPLIIVAQNGDVLVKNGKLFVDNTEFFVKAVCYSPSPLGFVDIAGDGTGGTGMCSPRRQYPIMVNDPSQLTPVPLSACAEDDFFDAGTDPQNPAAPTQWYKAAWERDFPYLKALGVNTVRIYHTNPHTTLAVKANPGVYTDQEIGYNHVPFMDMAQSYGIKVIFSLYDDKTAILTLPTETMEEYLRNGIDEVGNHPALLMWAFGNEMGEVDNTAFLDKVNHYLGYIRQYTKTKWNRSIPVSTFVVDLPSSYDFLARYMDVDIFSTNAGYRGPTFSDLFSGNPGQGFSGWHSLTCTYNKPVFIGEIGQHSTDGWFNDPTWFTQVWTSLLESYQYGCIGGALFEWSDEAWKAENQRDMGVVKYVPTVYQNENGQTVNSTMVNAFKPDTIRKKYAGAYNWATVRGEQGQTVSMRTDIFEYLCREPFTMDNVPDICNGYTEGENRCPVVYTYDTAASTSDIVPTVSLQSTGPLSTNNPPNNQDTNDSPNNSDNSNDDQNNNQFVSGASSLKPSWFF